MRRHRTPWLVLALAWIGLIPAPSAFAADRPNVLFIAVDDLNDGVGFYRPHIPLFAPAKYFEPFPAASIRLPVTRDDDLDDLGATARNIAVDPVTAGSHATVLKYHQWKPAVAAYLACVHFVDAQIGRILDALDAGPHRDNTIIVLWGDHGWHLGEKQHWGKWTGWERAARVPPATARTSPPAGRAANP